jgi:hypothetical protein
MVITHEQGVLTNFLHCDAMFFIFVIFGVFLAQFFILEFQQFFFDSLNGFGC